MPNESDLLTMDGFDDCIAGIVERSGQPNIICYHTDKVLAKLQDQGMSPIEALEYFTFNQLNSWVGDTTPCFLSPMTFEEIVANEMLPQHS